MTTPKPNSINMSAAYFSKYVISYKQGKPNIATKSKLNTSKYADILNQMTRTKQERWTETKSDLFFEFEESNTVEVNDKQK